MYFSLYFEVRLELCENVDSFVPSLFRINFFCCLVEGGLVMLVIFALF